MSTLFDTSIRTYQLADAARGLRSEHGENPEYDRALVELVTDSIPGLNQDDKEGVAADLGIVLASPGKATDTMPMPGDTWRGMKVIASCYYSDDAPSYHVMSLAPESPYYAINLYWDGTVTPESRHMNIAGAGAAWADLTGGE